MLSLLSHQLPVKSIQLIQFLMGSFLNNPSMIHDIDPVTVHNGGKTVGHDHTGGSLFPEGTHCILFGKRIHVILVNDSLGF